MSDPRWPDVEDRELLTHRQPGLNAEEDFKIVQTETNRRRDNEATASILADEPNPVFPEPDAPPDTPPAALGPDRWHKWGTVYVYVSKDHRVGEDPVLNPGYKSASAQFSSIADAYEYAGTFLIPKLPDDGRVVVVVSGGNYEEPLSLAYARVDLQGLGRPIISGRMVVLPQNNSMYMKGFRIYVPPSDGPVPAQVLPNLPGGDGDGPMPPIVFEDCIFDGGSLGSRLGIGDVFLFDRRIRSINCDFHSYASGALPAKCRFRPDFGGEADFFNCRFYGYANPSTNRPSSYSFLATAKVLGGYYSNPETAGTGVRFFNCQHYGTIRNEGWRVVSDGCKVHGGVQLPTGPFTIGYIGVSDSNALNPALSVSSITQIDDTRVTASLVFVSIDDAIANGTGTNNVLSRKMMNLLPSGFPSNAQAFAQTAAPFAGRCVVALVDAQTHCAVWAIAPIVFTATASNTAIAVADMTDYSIL